MPARIAIALFTILLPATIYAQQKNQKLTVEKIMSDPKWIGTSPANVSWSQDGSHIYFEWNPDKKTDDSLYSYELKSKKIQPLVPADVQKIVSADNIVYNNTRNAFLYVKDGDIFYTEKKTGKTKRITTTEVTESNPVFSFNETAIVYNSENDLYAWFIATGETEQLTAAETKSVKDNKNNKDSSGQQKWLTGDRLNYFEVLKSRRKKTNEEEANKNLFPEQKKRKIPLGEKRITSIRISPDGRFINYTLRTNAAGEKQTIVPAYVTESGYTEDIPARSKVGSPQSINEFFLYDRQADTIIKISVDSIPGIRDIPAYIKENYPGLAKELQQKNELRIINAGGPSWSPGGVYTVMDFYSIDNKDRWLMLVDETTGKLKLLDRQHDDAWIAGAGIFGSDNKGWITATLFWFRSEMSGYSHLYAINVLTGERKALTAGNYEVQQAKLSADKKYFYITTNEVHPGEQQFYRLSIADGKKERITTMTGANKTVISPDEKYIALSYSFFNKPWELYLQENKPGGKLIQITDKAQTDEFKNYPWRIPELITFKARDNAEVYARLYKPAIPHPDKPAVIFVHGAGYLQNAHKWWSDYFREYMFHNLLAENGYYVMDVDYRGSAGYGRDWRTGIYRHMGGKDLTDQLDAADYLVKNLGVDAKRIGIYGGSYGGFITLMALFTAPDVFAAGAALRPVTNWANYNHGYTSDILNEPATDSIAYRRSSPIYFAEGLKNHLLICHGMVDVNVHYQDAVELAQRLIELGKDNWELASYPMEDHGFVEPSSWTDEYKRIFKLFETVLKSKNK